MRNLQTRDIFAFVRMVDEIGLKDELKNMIMTKDNIADLTAESFGYDLIFTILDKASSTKAEASVYEFFGGLFEIDPKECATMDALEFIEKVMEVADVEKWKAFFTSAAKLMK